MDKTYSEVRGEVPFDWNKWLDAAIENRPSNEDHEKKSGMARMWVTCACGNQCAIIPRHESSPDSGIDGMPIDRELRSLGVSFFCEIQDRHYRAAKSVLQDIEERSQVLIAEELKKLNS